MAFAIVDGLLTLLDLVVGLFDRFRGGRRRESTKPDGDLSESPAT